MTLSQMMMRVLVLLVLGRVIVMMAVHRAGRPLDFRRFDEVPESLMDASRWVTVHSARHRWYGKPIVCYEAEAMAFGIRRASRAQRSETYPGAWPDT